MRALIENIRSFLHKFNRSPKDLKLDDEIIISKKVFRKHIGKNPQMIDCGAHDGADSIELVETLGGKIHSFEALPFVYEKLLKNTQNNTSIKCYQLALGSVNGKVPFFVSSGESIGSSSLLPPKDHLVDHPATKFEETIYVDSITLDCWAEQNNIKKIDFLWLDMQGAEKIMLEAAPKMLKTVKAVYSEVCIRESYEGVTVYEDYKEWMYQQGFKVEMELIPKGWDCGNVFFVRKDRIK